MKVLRYYMTALKLFSLVVIIIINNIYKLFNEKTGYEILKPRYLMKKKIIIKLILKTILMLLCYSYHLFYNFL